MGNLFETVFNKTQDIINLEGLNLTKEELMSQARMYLFLDWKMFFFAFRFFFLSLKHFSRFSLLKNIADKIFVQKTYQRHDGTEETGKLS